MTEQVELRFRSLNEPPDVRLMPPDQQQDRHGADWQDCGMGRSEEAQRDEKRDARADGCERHEFDGEQQEQEHADGDQPRAPVHKPDGREPHHNGFAALEAIPDRVGVPEHGEQCAIGCSELEVAPCIADEVSRKHAGEDAFAEVEQKDEPCEFPPVHALEVGKPGILTPLSADVLPIDHLRQQDGGIHSREKVGDDCRKYKC